MTVKELKHEIKDLPDTMDIMVLSVDGEFEYGLATEAFVKKIPFRESPGGRVEARDNVFIIKE